MSDAYVISLSGYKRDDDQKCVVSKGFAEWVEQGTQATLEKVIVEIIAKGLSKEDEEEVLEMAKEDTPGSGSSPANDRALIMCWLYENLESTSELLKAVSGKNIVWEFEGYVY